MQSIHVLGYLYLPSVINPIKGTHNMIHKINKRSFITNKYGMIGLYNG